jgi:hypothetical protein
MGLVTIRHALDGLAERNEAVWSVNGKTCPYVGGSAGSRRRRELN